MHIIKQILSLSLSLSLFLSEKKKEDEAAMMAGLLQFESIHVPITFSFFAFSFLCFSIFTLSPLGSVEFSWVNYTDLP